MKEPDLDFFVSNARKTLVEAQVLCQEASMRIYGAKGKISQWQQDVSKLKFMIGCLQNQGDFLYKNVLKSGIGESLIKTEWSQVVLIDLINTMKYWQEQLSSRVTQLDRIDNTLLNSNINSGEELHRKLGDFIPKENLNILDERLKEIPIIRRQIDNIKSQYSNMVKKVAEQLMYTKLKSIEELFEEKFGPTSTDSIELGEKYLEEMTNLEHELVEFLNSLTDHFDKCKLLQTRNLEAQYYQELLKIVTKDNSELSSILDTLRDTINDVDQILLKFTNTFEKKTIDKNTIHSNINKIINEFHKHQEYLLIFKDISDLISTFKETCLQEIQITQELCQFYQTFEASYYKLLKEADRRRSVAKQMADVIADCEQKLKVLDVQDHRIREKFLAENGNYLPETIWPGKIDDLTPLYSLQYNIQDI